MLVAAAVSVGTDNPAVSGMPLRIATALVILALLAYALLVRPLRHGRLSSIPGPWLNKISSLQLAFYDVRHRRNRKILEWHRRYGPVVCISPNEVSVAGLAEIKVVYGATQGWAKSSFFDHFTGYGQRSVFAARTHREHREKRRLTSAFYQASSIYRLPELERHISDRCRAVVGHIERARSGGGAVDVDVYSLTDWYALDVITFVVLGRAHATHAVEQAACPERAILRRLKQLQFAGPFRVRFPAVFACLAPLLGRWSPRRLGFLAADAELADWCQRRLSAAMDDPRLSRSPSLLRQLLRQRRGRKQQQYGDGEAEEEEEEEEGGEGKGEGGPPLDRAFVAAEALDNIHAAEATVTVTATYLIWLLSAHPHWQRTIRAELRALLPPPVPPPRRSDSADGCSLAFADVDARAPALDACLREAYRLYPAASGRAERVVPAHGATLAGLWLPPGTVVASCVLAVHHDERHFPAPDRFAPERWLLDDDGDDETAKAKAREAHLIPFGYGGRICLGKALATMEIKMLVAALYLRYESAVTASSATAEAMGQSSTQDALPRAADCVLRFREVW